MQYVDKIYDSLFKASNLNVIKILYYLNLFLDSIFHKSKHIFHFLALVLNLLAII